MNDGTHAMPDHDKIADPDLSVKARNSVQYHMVNVFGFFFVLFLVILLEAKHGKLHFKTTYYR